MSRQRYHYAKRKLALIIPAHNEEVVLGDTIQSAIAAGQNVADIFVVSDGSRDATVAVASEFVDPSNILDQPQGGKAMAIFNGIKHFGLEERYRWVHIADADGVFSPTYFSVLRQRLNSKYVAATGHVQSLQGGWISKYRTYEYTIGLEILRRIQNFFGVIPVIPGATSVFRTDIIKKLDFTQHSLTEDMDLTMQIHRHKLGRIAYIPQAKAFTQDPKDFSDYYKQIQRWYRGAFQVMTRHRIGLRPHRIDLYMGYMILEEVVLLLEILLLPVLAYISHSYVQVAELFLGDFLVFLGFTLWSGLLNRRHDVVEAFPLFYLLRFVNLYVFFASWFEIVVLRKFRTARPGWSTAGRRYRIVTDAGSN
ncbi:MAG TPA: glycosyltransferase family 2 protein [Candidatus Saccharimonadia bacterium]|nr:glycosyltransferase family 2 protein [Candidatus Saccharimonadia bacterium]